MFVGSDRGLQYQNHNGQRWRGHARGSCEPPATRGEGADRWIFTNRCPESQKGGAERELRNLTFDSFTFPTGTLREGRNHIFPCSHLWLGRDVNAGFSPGFAS